MMREVPQFYQKNGWTVVRLARDLLNMDVGDRLDSVAQYAERFQSGRGTIQYAIKYLLDNGCVSLNRQGPKGTFITRIDTKCLWEYAGWGTLLLACPVPTDKYLESILSGFYANFTSKEIPFNFILVPNSGDRLRELKNQRYHAAITSRLAMKVLADRYPELAIVEDMEGEKGYEAFVLMHTKKNFDGIKDGMSIVLNTQSLEQWYLANILCEGKNVIMRNMPQQEAAHAIERGELDLLIARPYISREIQGNLHMESLSHLQLDAETSAPVLVANTETYGIVKLLRKILDPAYVSDVQKKVLMGQQKAVYY